MKWIRSNVFSFVMLVALFIGVCFLLYPTVSDYWNSLHHTQAILNYSETIAKMKEEDYSEILEDAHAYNALLSKSGINWHMSYEQTEVYMKKLHFNESGNMGYIDIPKINTKLSIFHGTDEEVLQTSVGHLAGTSLPVGGSGTHTALSAHRGLPSAKLFSDLDKLTYGDIFTLHILNETLTYEVDQIRVVLPNNVSDIQIEEGKDYCTLITCTPYGVNSHRLLVRAKRIANIDGEATVIADAIQLLPLLIAPFIIFPIILLLVLYMLIITSNRYLKRGSTSYLAWKKLEKPVLDKKDKIWRKRRFPYRRPDMKE